MKDCRFCYSQINQRARICPQCHNHLSVMGSFRAFLITAFPILTAIISLGFAFFEKYEKRLVQTSLAKTENRLKVSEVQNSVAEEAVLKLSAIVPRMMMSRRDVGPDADPSVIVKTLEQELDEIESKLANLSSGETANLHEVKKLTQQKLELEYGVSFSRSNQ